MKIYTSYYAKTKTLIRNNIVPISVSLYNPSYLKSELKCTLGYLAPRYNMLKMSESEYTPKFLDLLKKIDPKRVIEDLKQASQGKDCALMCYEVPTDFCHRCLIANWLNEKTEYDVKEWSGIKEKPASIQIPLF